MLIETFASQGFQTFLKKRLKKLIKPVDRVGGDAYNSKSRQERQRETLGSDRARKEIFENIIAHENQAKRKNQKQR
ncbi:hypothetical protein [Alkalibacter mobilis]|uniref:hypothetical protein n=1 Tax=Alkalibacter mobilis TaxID=2787712 RepID=UPI00189F8435|nr:hypothetical protein [Alkalibacter mobilis]